MRIGKTKGPPVAVTLLLVFTLGGCRETPTEPAVDVSPARAAGRGTYTAVDLGTLGGASSAALDINARGQVVGLSEMASGERHAFLSENGVMTDLGTLGGSTSEANAISPQGQVVGFSNTASGDEHAFLWAKGVMTDLGTLGPDPSGFSFSHATTSTHGNRWWALALRRAGPYTPFSGRRAS